MSDERNYAVVRAHQLHPPVDDTEDFTFLIAAGSKLTTRFKEDQGTRVDKIIRQPYGDLSETLVIIDGGTVFWAHRYMSSGDERYHIVALCGPNSEQGLGSLDHPHTPSIQVVVHRSPDGFLSLSAEPSADQLKVTLGF